MVYPKNGRYLSSDDFPIFKGKSVSLCLTHDCNLRCSYCYLHYKSASSDMPPQVAKKVIELMFQSPTQYLLPSPCIPGMQPLEKEANAPSSPYQVSFDVIGGEPLMNMTLLNSVSDLILRNAIERGVRSHFYFNIGTNGTLYNTDLFQRYLRKYSDLVRISITIDGTKEMHDRCRKYASGEGSYDIVIKNLKLCRSQFPDVSTKVTICPENLEYLAASMIHLWRDLDFQYVPANTVFEPVWQKEHEREYQLQLERIADFLLQDNNFQRYCTTLFRESVGRPMDPSDLTNACGGNGKMLFVDIDGKYYNCIRFAPFSCKNQKGLVLGDYLNGWDLSSYQRLASVDRRTSSDDECFYCPIALECGSCLGAQYDHFGDANTKNKNICGMHKVRTQVNKQFFSDLRRKAKIIDSKGKVIIIPDSERNLQLLADCYNYKSQLRCYLAQTDASVDKQLVDPAIEEYRKTTEKISSLMLDLSAKARVGDKLSRYNIDIARGYFFEAGMDKVTPSTFSSW